jgi:hypothetical protein
MTTYPTSTAPDAKAWLFTQMQSTLTVAAGFSFECTYASMIDTVDAPDDQVSMGAITNRVVSGFALVGDQGQYSTQEEYDLTVEISCFRPGLVGDTAEARAWALAGQVETIARTDPTFGGLLVTSRPNQSSSTVDWSAEEDANGRIASLTLTIHCFAVI